MSWRSIALALLFTILAPSLASAPASAASTVKKVWDDVRGVILDPFKVRSASQELASTLERTAAQLKELQSKTNLDLKERITQIGEIVNTALAAFDQGIADIDQVINNAVSKLRDIEQQTYADAVDLIYRTQCATEVVLTDQLQRAMEKLIEGIRESDPGIDFLGIRVVDISVGTIQIVDPDLAYRSTKQYYMSKIRGIEQDGDAYLILSTYQNLARFARFARCHYLQGGLAARFVEEEAEFERLSDPWLQGVRPTL